MVSYNLKRQDNVFHNDTGNIQDVRQMTENRQLDKYSVLQPCLRLAGLSVHSEVETLLIIEAATLNSTECKHLKPNDRLLLQSVE